MKKFEKRSEQKIAPHHLVVFKSLEDFTEDFYTIYKQLCTSFKPMYIIYEEFITMAGNRWVVIRNHANKEKALYFTQKIKNELQEEIIENYLDDFEKYQKSLDVSND